MMELISFFFSQTQLLVSVALSFAVFAVSLWALVDAVLTPPNAFTSEGKRTKGFWLALNALAVALSFVGVGGLAWLLVVVIPGVYLADVRPAVRTYRQQR